MMQWQGRPNTVLLIAKPRDRIVADGVMAQCWKHVSQNLTWRLVFKVSFVDYDLLGGGRSFLFQLMDVSCKTLELLWNCLTFLAVEDRMQLAERASLAGSEAACPTQ